MTVQQLLKNAAVNGIISIDNALKVAETFDKEREETKSLLRECERNVGMYLGEKINAHIAEMDGTFFNERDYHYEKPVGEQ